MFSDLVHIWLIVDIVHLPVILDQCLSFSFQTYMCLCVILLWIRSFKGQTVKCQIWFFFTILVIKGQQIWHNSVYYKSIIYSFVKFSHMTTLEPEQVICSLYLIWDNLALRYTYRSFVPQMPLKARRTKVKSEIFQ